MINLIEQNGDNLAELCRRFHVQRLELIGSAADGTFDPARSDLDFLVEFLPLQRGQYFNTYFDLLDGLRELFHRKVDLVMSSAIRNPTFLNSVNQQRKVVYAA